jgi:hypothetical protein
MNTEQWIQQNLFSAISGGEIYGVVSVDDLRDLFRGKVLVPVEALSEVIRISDRDHEAWVAVKAALTASQEPKQ